MTQTRVDAAVVERGRVLLHRREPGRLLYVRSTNGVYAYVTRITGVGLRPAGAHRASRVRVRWLEAAFQLYMPCRWDLQCLQQRTVTVQLVGLGDVDACVEHAAEHLLWQRADPRRRGDEPTPDCWCTDTDRLNGMRQDYCPAHGTPHRRGTDIDILGPEV